MRRNLRVLLGVVVAVLLSGCVALPTTGPVQTSDRVANQRSEPDITLMPEPPRSGAPPLEIARGFLEAIASGRAGDEVARQYLTPAAATEWNPRTTIVYRDAPDGGPDAPLSERQEARVVLEARKLGEIRSDGTWAAAEPSEAIEHHFEMTSVDGEWRIGRPPNGRLMSRYYMEREYEQLNRFYFDEDVEVLVPDPVFLPIHGTRETLLVQSLLSGPSQWLQPAVRSAIPAATELAAPSVVVEGGVARVELNEAVLALSAEQRRLLSAQLARTLKEAGIDRFMVTVDQAPLQIEGINEPTQEVNAWSRYDPARAAGWAVPHAIAQGGVVAIDEGELVALAGPLGSGELQARGVAPALSGDRVAAVTKDGTKVVVTTLEGTEPASQRATDTAVVAEGTDIATVSWDRRGRLWVLDNNGGRAKITMVTSSGELRTVSASGLAGRDVLALRVARDGVRAAALVRRGGAIRVVVGRISDRDDLTIDGVRALPTPALRPDADIAWADIDEVVLLGGRQQPGPLLLSVDGSTQVESAAMRSAGGAPPGAISVTGAPDQPLIVGVGGNEIWRLDPILGWTTVGAGQHPAYPG